MLPPQLSKIKSATIVESSGADIMLCHDEEFLYGCKLFKDTKNATFQKFALPGLQRLEPIIKAYFLGQFDNHKITIFEACLTG